MKSHLTNLGIPGIGAVPYGFHMCHFYHSGRHLSDALVPYFLAGLENNERGLWIGSSPLPAAKVLKVISKHPLLKQSVASGQLRIMDALEWFGEPASLDLERILQNFIDEEQRALADGYEGLRITGNTSFISGISWSDLMAYEECFHRRIREHRIVACCSYDHRQCGPVDILEVSRCHDGTFYRSDKHWQLILKEIDGSWNEHPPSPAGSDGIERASTPPLL